MQLQLSLGVADRLHEALLVRGEPLHAADAARLLTASADVPSALGREILEALVVQDRRFRWAAADTNLLSLVSWEVPDPDFATVPFVALDLETTGARAGTSKITEVGAVRIEGLQEVRHFSTLVNPMRPIPPMITQITGITQEMVSGAPRIEEVLPGLLEFLEGAVVVAHNAPFDVGFLNYELQRLNGKRLGEGAIDTLPLARALAPGLPNYRLHTVAAALDAPVAACHRALADAQAAGHVFVTLAGLLQERGITRLGEMRACVSPGSRSALEKLSLTRDLPRTPGTYRFLDKEGQILYVGKADRLAERVRSYFVAGASHSRKVRKAVRMVERVEYDRTHTPLEAVVQEQQLILQHRPPCNIYGTRPETYAYIKAGGGRSGLALVASCRPPKWLTASGEDMPRNPGSLVLGPFRNRSGLQAVLELLQRCYPIRRCPQRRDQRPCIRGTGGRCLAPCTGDPRARRDHDALLTDILHWIAGRETPSLADPLERAEELVQSLSHQRRFEEAKRMHQASEHLLSVRRSYETLAEARDLCFAALWPQAGGGQDGHGDDREGRGEAHSVRLNLVWMGRPENPVTLCPDSMEETLAAVFAAVWARRTAHPASGAPAFVAVPQKDLDSLLAVRRWFYEAEHVVKIRIDPADAGASAQAILLSRLVTAAGSLLAEDPALRTGSRPTI